MTEDVTPRPAVRVSDAEREQAVARLQTALGEGRITVDEFGQRAHTAYGAMTADQLERLLADLPATTAVELVGTHSPSSLVNVVGDVRLDARSGVPRRVRTGFGDIRVDLRDLRTDADVVELELSTVLGDIDVVVPEGVDAELDGWSVLGDRRVELAPVPRLAGTPRVVVRAHAGLGDVRLRSLPPGESAGRWRALLDRLAQRPRPALE